MSGLVSTDNILRLPLGNRVALAEIVKSESQVSSQVFVVHAGLLPDYFDFLPLGVDWIDIKLPGETIGHSLALAFQRIFGSIATHSPSDSASKVPARLVFADTVSSLDGLDLVAVGSARSSEDWTFAPSNFSEDVIQGRAAVDSQSVIAGAFSFSDLNTFAELISEKVAAHDPLQFADPFFEAVRSYSRTLKVGLAAYSDDSWHDLGHPEGYFDFRQTQLEGRAFNSFVSRPGGLFVRKTSRHSGKLLNELNWFKSVPPGLSRFLPRVIVGGRDYYEVQYVRALTLAEKVLYGQEAFMDLSFITTQFDKWFTATALKSRERISPPEASRHISEFSEWFTANINSRLAQIETDASLLRLDLERVKLILEQARNLVAKVSFEGEEVGIVHGDLIFSNVLVNERDGVFKLIDPRGGFGSATHLGLQIYDWAKISQSVHGRYEELVSGEYRIVHGDDEVILSMDVDRLSNYAHLSEWFEASCPSPAFAKQIAGLLLISAIPFHMEDPKRATAMLLQGERLAKG